MLHSFLSERKWGYYVQMHDNKEREWREHSFLTPTLLHHTPIATLCHPTPSFLPVLFLVYWIFLFFPDPETNLAVLCSEHCFGWFWYTQTCWHVNLPDMTLPFTALEQRCSDVSIVFLPFRCYNILNLAIIFFLYFTLMSFFGQCIA